MTEAEKYKAGIKEQIQSLKDFFSQGKTRSIDFRLKQLKTLEQTIKDSEKEILHALTIDLRKSPEEGYLTEISIVLSEIKLHIRNLKKWAKPRKVSTPVYLFPSRSYTIFEPLGLTLILSPWNYPFQLLINPLIGAISAGNCAVLKPSPFSPATNEVIKTIISRAFPPQYISVIEGNSWQTQTILTEKFDFIFYTGSPTFGKEVMRAASENLTPLILELGGKSPCIVDLGSNIDLAAKRIAWGKLLNAGQTCIAPDYIFVHKSLEKQLIQSIKSYMTKFYGEDASSSPYYPRIITNDAFNRLKSYLGDGDIQFGGETDETGRYISPTIMNNIKPDGSIMQNEIFGPILPVLTFQNTGEVINYITSRPKPLALYYFGKTSAGKEIIEKTTSGGACINDVILHIANHNLPFGGVGNSGTGRYHGKYSFRAFSNQRALMISSSRFDFIFKYVPFRYFSVARKIMS